MLLTDAQKAKLMDFLATDIFMNSNNVDTEAAVLFTTTGESFYKKVIKEYELYYKVKFE